MKLMGMKLRGMPIFRKLEVEEESSGVRVMITEVGGGLGSIVCCFYGDKYSTVLKLQRSEENQMSEYG